MRTIKTYRKVGAFYIAWEEDLSTPIDVEEFEKGLIQVHTAKAWP